MRNPIEDASDAQLGKDVPVEYIIRDIRSVLGTIAGGQSLAGDVTLLSPGNSLGQSISELKTC